MFNIDHSILQSISNCQEMLDKQALIKKDHKCMHFYMHVSMNARTCAHTDKIMPLSDIKVNRQIIHIISL